jgi:SnoaL-like domain
MNQANANQVHDLVERYFAVWNEMNAGRRRDLIARTWTETATYLDPMLQADGREGIDAMVKAVQERFPGHKFRLRGPIDSHHDRVRFSWDMASGSGVAVASGIDFGVVADGQRLQAVTGFLDAVPGA